MINISFTHIITDKRRIENTPHKVFYVLPPEQKRTSIDEDTSLKDRTYKLDCGQAVYEIICPEIQDDGTKYLCVAEFHIPGRPYPIYIYLYGIIMYSSNPEMGQREAAEKTRKKFGLETFCHTTLGRAIKKLEVRIKAFWDKPEFEEPSSEHSGCFPSVEHTRKRRDYVITFLAEASGENNQMIQDTLHPQPLDKYKRPPYKGAFFDVCHRIVNHTFKK